MQTQQRTAAAIENFHGIMVLTATLTIASNETSGWNDKGELIETQPRQTVLTLCKDSAGNFVWGFEDETAECGMAIETTIPVTEEQLRFIAIATGYARNTWTVDLAETIELPF